MAEVSLRKSGWQYRGGSLSGGIGAGICTGHVAVRGPRDETEERDEQLSRGTRGLRCSWNVDRGTF